MSIVTEGLCIMAIGVVVVIFAVKCVNLLNGDDDAN